MENRRIVIMSGQIRRKKDGKVSGKLNLRKLQSYVQYWLADGKYDGKPVEESFKRVFGTAQPVFGCTSHRSSGTKIAVTAGNITESSLFLFTNYNARRIGNLGKCLLLSDENSLTVVLDYSVLPHDRTEPRVWEV